jgi:hypothetical protein
MVLWGWGALEADFFRYYQKDLYTEVWVNQISSRRFIVLVSGLPPDSAWARFLQNEENYELAKNFT